MGNRVIVTGGAGFIGSHIVDQLIENGDEPFVIDDLSSGSKENIPADVKLYQTDICDSEEIARIFDEVKPDAVSHQAAQMSVSRSVREPVFDAQVNIFGLLNILENAIRVKTQKVIFAASGGVLYGEVNEPATELSPVGPISPYGITKFAGEQYLQFYSREHDLQTVALRYANVYGPRQNPHGEAGVVAIFNQKMLSAEPPTIFGDGSCIRDYVYGIDVAKANRTALNQQAPEDHVAYNVGTSIKCDVNELAAHIRSACQKYFDSIGKDIEVPAPIHGPDRPGDLQSSVVDASKIEAELGWKPEFDLAKGLQATTDWFAERIA